MAPTNDSTVREYNLICKEDPLYDRVAEILSVPNALILGRIIVRVEPKSGTTTATATARAATTRKTTTRRKTATKRTRRTSPKSRRK